jgi:uncharacterized protein YkwD
MRISKPVLLLSIGVLACCQTVGVAFSDSNNSDPKPTISTEPAARSLSAKWKEEDIDTALGADYLTDTEKQVLVEINKVRTDPAQYAMTYLQPIKRYYRGRMLQYPNEIAIQTTEGVHALDECITVLMSSKALKALSPKKGLALAARDQAKDQAKTGATGHAGSDHSTVTDRMNRYGKWEHSAGENIDYGNSQAQRIVISFLVDDGVPSRGHRKNLLDNSFSFIGVAVGPHLTYGSMCVLDLAGGYK